MAIGASVDGTDVLDWKNVGTVTSYRVQHGKDGSRLRLDANRDYYLSLRAMGHQGEVVGTVSSQAWFIYEPYTFDASQYPLVTQDAPNSFWGVRHPIPQFSQWDDKFEAYASGSAAVDLYKALGERVLTGSSELTILQTERNFPTRSDVTRLGAGEADSKHADTVASMLYDCKVVEARWTYHLGCQTNPLKYSMTSSELRSRLNEFVLTSQNADAFEAAVFGDVNAPDVWSMAHSNPTIVNRTRDYSADRTAGLRLGDWIFSRFNILAVSPQPGDHTPYKNSTISGNYYNSIVVGKKSYNTTYAAQSSVDNEIGPRYKPDIVVSASNLLEASSWSVPTLAAAASAFLGLAHSEPLLSGATHMQTMKAIILAGAGKDHLCPESITETEGYCEALPSPSEQWQWSNSASAPLDPQYGTGLFNYRNSFDILTAGRSVGGVDSRDEGWDTQELVSGQRVSYAFTVSETNDAFSLALTWNRDISVDSEGILSSHMADFQVELRDGANRVVGRSDDPGNNIEHIYLPEGLEAGQSYEIVVTLKSSDVPVRYGLAWQVRTSALQHSPWRE